MSGSGFVAGIKYTKPADCSAADVVVTPGAVCVINSNLTTNGVVKLTYANGSTGVIPVAAMQYVAVNDFRLVWKTGTTAGIQANIIVGYG